MGHLTQSLPLKPVQLLGPKVSPQHGASDDYDDDNDDMFCCCLVCLFCLFVLLSGGEHWATALPEDSKHNGHAWGTQKATCSEGSVKQAA